MVIINKLKNGEQHLILQGIEHWCKIAGSIHNTIPLVVVHGGPGGNHYVFERTIGVKLEGFSTVIYYEQRGSGRSQAPIDDNDYSMDTLVEDLEELRKALDIPKIYLLGYSFGGQICLEYALKYPRFVGKLILQAPFTGNYEHMYNLQLQGFATVAKDEIKQCIDALCNSEISLEEKYNQVWQLVDTDTVDRLLFVDEKFAKLNRSLWEESRLINTGIMAKALFENQPCIPLIERVENIKADTLIIVGEYDRNTGIESSKDIANGIENSHLVVFEHSAHFPDIEETDNVVKTIAKFLNEPTSVNEDYVNI
ncbi:alpha/beta fold hydrolase [Bacillus mycoides]|uniref:alpha/beta fold hydrolase n=1 Tax=Bacillus mycoides TaxID=1405 RepID=UPI00366F0802